MPGFRHDRSRDRSDAVRCGQCPPNRGAFLRYASAALRPDGCERRAPSLHPVRSEEHTSELQSLMRISYAVFCLKKKSQKSYILTHATTSHVVYTHVILCIQKQT